LLLVSVSRRVTRTTLFPYTTLFRSERIPGVRPMVVEHEEAAEWVEQLFIGLLIIEATALGLSVKPKTQRFVRGAHLLAAVVGVRSEEHTSELQSRENLVCRLLLEKK